MASSVCFFLQLGVTCIRRYFFLSNLCIVFSVNSCYNMWIFRRIRKIAKSGY